MTASSSSPSPPLLVEVFLRYLKAEGTEVVFGIPGGLLYPFFDAIEQDPDLRYVLAKHECGAAFMADGYARVSDRLAVCAGTSGPGATNLLTGVACAFADGVPMLVVTGQAATHALGKGAAQETNREDIDIVEIFRPVTRYSAMVTTAESAPHHLRRALRAARTGRPGPVHLNIPVDLWANPVQEDWFDPTTYRPATHPFDRRAVQRAAELLLSATHPVILAGSGVAIARAEDHLRAVAELLTARVATTPRGKGVLPETHPLSLGVLGLAGHRTARDVVFGDVDVLLTVGASLNETSTFNWHPDLRPSRALLQLDIDPERVGRNYPVDVPLVGDAQAILVELVYHVHRRIREGHRPGSQWRETYTSTRNHDWYVEPEMRTSDSVPITPQRWRAELQEVLPPRAIIFSDIGGHMLFNIHHLCIEEGQRFVLNLGFGSMGHGTVAPIGAALADPTRPVFAIVGDGCFTMNGMELICAREEGTPVIWIVENNQMHGITWHISRLLGGGRPLETVRYRHGLEAAAIARAMGLRAWVVDRPGQIGPAVREALEAREPSLIEVRVDPRLVPPIGERTKSLTGFMDSSTSA